MAGPDTRVKAQLGVRNLCVIYQAARLAEAVLVRHRLADLADLSVHAVTPLLSSDAEAGSGHCVCDWMATGLINPPTHKHLLVI